MTRQTVTLIFLVALAIRLAYLAVGFDDPNTLRAADSAIFESAAAGIVDTGRVVTISPNGGAQVFVARAPGYAGWLALFRWLFGENPLYPVAAQVLLDAFACVLVAWLAGFANARLSIVAGGMAALNPNMILHAVQIGPWSLTLFFLLAALVYAARYYLRPTLTFSIGAGLTYGAAWLIMPDLELFFPVLLATLAISAWRRGMDVAGGMVHVLIAVLTAAVFVGPFYYKNYIEFGSPRLSNEYGPRLFNRITPAVLELGAGMPRAESRALLKQRLAARLSADGKAELSGNPFETSNYLGLAAKDILRDAGMGTVAKAWLTGVAINLFAPAIVATPMMKNKGPPDFSTVAGHNTAQKIWNVLAQGGLWSLFTVIAAVITAICRFCSIAALFQFRRTLAPSPTIILLLVAVYFLFAGGPVIGFASRLPAEPVLDILLAAALVWLADRWWQWRVT